MALKLPGVAPCPHRHIDLSPCLRGIGKGDGYPQIVHRNLTSSSGGYVLHNVLTHRECQQIIAATEQLGYGKAAYPQSYRGNRRAHVDETPGRVHPIYVNGPLTAIIWDRIRVFVPHITLSLASGQTRFNDNDEDESDLEGVKGF